MSLEAPTSRTSRRDAFAMLGAAGVAGLGASLLASTRAAATAPPSESTPAEPAPTAPAPSAPTAADSALIGQVIGLELAAAELYQIAAGTLNGDGAKSLATTFGNNHEAYAEALSGLAGIKANSPDEATVEKFRSDFDTTDLAKFGSAAAELEATAAATHTELLGLYESTSPRSVSASILVVEARQATVMNDVAGYGDDLDTMLTSDAEPVDLEEAAG